MNTGIDKRWLRIGAIGIVVLGLLVLVIAITANSRSSSNGHDTRYYDKYSGETVSTIKGKSPESAGQNSNQPTYLGFDLLITHGFTQDQLSDIQTGYQQYFSQSKMKVTEVSLYKATYKDAGPAPDNANIHLVTYTVVLNRKTMYKTELEPTSLSDLTIRLYNSDDKLVFTYSNNPDQNGPSN